MMEGEGFEEGDEDGIIAELEDRGDRASDLAAGDLGRQGQVHYPLPAFTFTVYHIMHGLRPVPPASADSAVSCGHGKSVIASSGKYGRIANDTPCSLQAQSGASSRLPLPVSAPSVTAFSVCLQQQQTICITAAKQRLAACTLGLPSLAWFNVVNRLFGPHAQLEPISHSRLSPACRTRWTTCPLACGMRRWTRT